MLEGGKKTIPLGIFQCFQMVQRRSRINQLKNLSSSLLAPLFGRWPILKYSFSGPRPALIELFQLSNQVFKLLHSPSHDDLHNIHKRCFQEISFHLCSFGTDECYDGKWVTLLSLCLWVFSIKDKAMGCIQSNTVKVGHETLCTFPGIQSACVHASWDQPREQNKCRDDGCSSRSTFFSNDACANVSG